MEANTLGYVHELKFRELTAKGENESIKTNVYSVIKLTKTVSEFCHKLAGIKEQTAASLNALVETFRRKTTEIRKRPECQSKTFLDAWDAILGEVENEAKDLTELGQQLQRSVACPLLRTVERKKHFCKKSFAYRESCQMQISKSEDELNKRHKDYSDAWYKFNTHEKENLKDHHIAVYHNEHNSFLLQLANVNSMNETHYKHTVPDILDDVETIHEDMNDSLLKYLKQFLGIQKDTLNKLITRMDNAVEVAKKIDVDADITNFVKFANQSIHDREIPFRQFFKPKATKEFKDQETKQLTYLDKAIIVDQFTEPMLKRTVAYSRKRIAELDASMRTLQSQINTSKELLQSDKESNGNQEPSVDEIEVLHKTNDFRDQRSLQNTLHAQMTLFTDETLEKLGPISDDYANDIGKQKTIIIGRPNDTTMLTRKEKPHQFIEHNFLKPAQCHYCKGIIVGLVKQGLKCQRCRMNVHKKCKRNVAFCVESPKESDHSKKVSSPVIGEDSLHDGESVYEEIEPEDLERIRRASRVSNQSQTPSSADDDYELPQDAANHANQRPLSTVVLAKSSPKSLPKQNLPLCVALFDFQGQESQDLSITSGDKIQIIDQSSEEWWEGICNGNRGYFPSSYVEKIDHKDVILRILYDFDGEEDSDEMSLEQGQIVVVVEDEGNGWTVGRSNGKRGAFPSSYAERL